jgi:integrase
VPALELALAKMKCERHTKEDATSVLKYAKQAAQQLKYDSLPIKDIKRKHIRLILDQCARTKARWSANTFNYYRAYLSLLFKELVEREAIEFNPVKEIAKQKATKLMRTVLRPIDKVLIKVHLTRKAPEFYRFIQIFFHSGARIGELLRLKGSDVNLKTQKYKCLIKKGKSFREVERTIKDLALPYWTEALQHCGKEGIVFSVGLQPGKKVIRSEQVTRRWEVHVKRDLKVIADFYSLKHLNTDETAALLCIKDAAAHNSHTSTVITMKHYAVGEKERQHERLKKVGNRFA